MDWARILAYVTGTVHAVSDWVGSCVITIKSDVVAQDPGAAIRRLRSHRGPLRPLIPTHAPGRLADARRPTDSSTVPIF
jgi:hypothetical protein